MSHNPERKDKNCLNCNAQVAGRFCQECGQENIETRESFWMLSRHFIFDVLHFDGKFFYTLKYIFTRPGYVPRQYAEGKRATYLHPIRMYLFTSALFFLVLFSTEKIKVNLSDIPDTLSVKDRVKMATSYKAKLKNKPSDTLYQNRIAKLLDTLNYPVLSKDSIGTLQGNAVTFGNRNYATVKEYDSVQALLPPNQRNGWFKHKLIAQSIQVNQKYKGARGASQFLDAFLHKMPYILFVSLPFFAGILKLLYFRRKNFYYSDHAVFTLYHYIFSFILLLVLFGIGELQTLTGWGIFSWLYIGAAFVWPVYLFIEMRRFYLQSKKKTLLKFLLLNALAFLVVILLFVVFLLLSLFQI